MVSGSLKWNLNFGICIFFSSLLFNCFKTEVVSGSILEYEEILVQHTQGKRYNTVHTSLHLAVSTGSYQ